LAVSATVLEIFTVTDRKLLILPTPSLFDAPSGGTPLDIDVIYTPLKIAFNLFKMKSYIKNTQTKILKKKYMGYNSVADIISLSSFV